MVPPLVNSAKGVVDPALFASAITRSAVSAMVSRGLRKELLLPEAAAAEEIFTAMGEAGGELVLGLVGRPGEDGEGFENKGEGGAVESLTATVT